MADIVERFMDALQETDRERTVEPLVPLFADDAVLERASQRSTFEGAEGARRFWEEYLDSTRELETTFTNVIRGGEKAVLEWRSEGRTADGETLRYRGVSILETRGDRIGAFRTYFDSAPFLPAGASTAG